MWYGVQWNIDTSKKIEERAAEQMRRAADKKEARRWKEEREQAKDALTRKFFRVYLSTSNSIMSSLVTDCTMILTLIVMVGKSICFSYLCWIGMLLYDNLGQMAGDAALTAVRGVEDSGKSNTLNSSFPYLYQ